MLVIILLTQIYNPGLSLGVLLPEEDTELFFGHLYHLRVENSFTRYILGPGIFVDFVYKSTDPYNDPHFINSGMPFIAKVGGVGLFLRYKPYSYFDFDIALGYYAGEMSYPTVIDSGIVSRRSSKRNSLGTTIAFNLHDYVGNVRTGIKVYVTLIPFGAKERPTGIWWEQQGEEELEYASLNSLGVGFTFGLGRKR